MSPAATVTARPIVAGRGDPPIAATGRTLVVREWSATGPTYLHVHRSDDEAWHVLEGRLRFRFADGEADAPNGFGASAQLDLGVDHSYLHDRHVATNRKVPHEAHPPNRCRRSLGRSRHRGVWG